MQRSQLRSQRRLRLRVFVLGTQVKLRRARRGHTRRSGTQATTAPRLRQPAPCDRLTAATMPPCLRRPAPRDRLKATPLPGARRPAPRDRQKTATAARRHPAALVRRRAAANGALLPTRAARRAAALPHRSVRQVPHGAESWLLELRLQRFRRRAAASAHPAGLRSRLRRSFRSSAWNS